MKRIISHITQIGQNLIVEKKEINGIIRTHIYFDDVIKNYSGSSNVKNEKIKKLNSKYFLENAFESNSNGVKAMCYMLDETIWSSFKNPNLAEFAVGGPSYESLREFYTAISNKSYVEYLEVNELGYYGPNTFWDTSKENSKLQVLDTKKSYLLSSSIDPSTVGNYLQTDKKEYIAYYGYYASGLIDYYPIKTDTNTTFFSNLSSRDFGFRPMVCLKSNIKLVEESDGTLSISK